MKKKHLNYFDFFLKSITFRLLLSDARVKFFRNIGGIFIKYEFAISASHRRGKDAARAQAPQIFHLPKYRQNRQ